MLKVTQELRRTGETLYEVRDYYPGPNRGKLVAVVTSDGFFSRKHFYGHVQRPDFSVIPADSDFGQLLLDTVAGYVGSK